MGFLPDQTSLASWPRAYVSRTPEIGCLSQLSHTILFKAVRWASRSWLVKDQNIFISSSPSNAFGSYPPLLPCQLNHPQLGFREYLRKHYPDLIGSRLPAIHLELGRLARRFKYKQEVESKLEEVRRQMELLLSTTDVESNLLERIIVYLLLYSFSIRLETITEFPRGIRHLCTTMPWTIWPSLVVLWGVCWMFAVYSPSSEKRPFSALSDPEQPWYEFFDGQLYGSQDDFSIGGVAFAYPSLSSGHFVLNDIYGAAAPAQSSLPSSALINGAPQLGFGQTSCPSMISEAVMSIDAPLDFMDPRAIHIGDLPEAEVAPVQADTTVPEDNSQQGPHADSSSGVISENTEIGNTVAGVRYTCQICGKSYSRPASLTRHVNSEHRSVRHRCSQCPKTYDRRDNMKRHEKTHGVTARGSSSRRPSMPRHAQLPGPAQPRPMGVSKLSGKKVHPVSSLVEEIDLIRRRSDRKRELDIHEAIQRYLKVSGEQEEGDEEDEEEEGHVEPDEEDV
ncbi:hypothetical protein B0T11DRAFT_114338 [Plectosphaerella cucumerina]|uniref:C2H2-type domain-containing protein n=1 Tax=Plectosphaerella cucumerina TaxID=40658 RepID=A0A8K0TCX5_9PEZI|nr:hypothetical protein B0T11DRAFT_114338 [Plectosphaerella cucumerina]